VRTEGRHGKLLVVSLLIEQLAHHSPIIFTNTRFLLLPSNSP